MPRYPLLGLPEFSTIAAHDHYNVRKRKARRSRRTARQDPSAYRELMPDLEALDRMIEVPGGQRRAVPRRYSGLAAASLGSRRERTSFPTTGRNYFEAMMGHIGYQPLPAV